MICYRLSKPQYSDDLTGTGAKMFGARWNSKGVPMLYTSSHISLALLEMLVHINFDEISDPLSLVSVSLPDTDVMEIKLQKLKNRWQQDISYTRFIGDEFVQNKKLLILKVPSAVVPEESNFLVNPNHPLFSKVRVGKTNEFLTDDRLFHT